MTLSEIRNFLAVADTGSIRAAARLRALSPPAITQSIARLEEEFHLPLLIRTSVGVKLTEFGTMFLRRARAIVAQVDGTSGDALQLLGGHPTKLTLGTSIVPGVTVLPGALRQFRRDYASVQLNLVSGVYQSHFTSLRSGEMDLAITTVPHFEQESDLCIERLYETDLVVVTRKDSPWENAKSLHELTDASWLILSGGASGTETIHEAFLGSGLPPPRAVMRADSLMFGEVLLTEIDSLTVLTREIARREPFASKTVVLEIAEPLPKLSVSLYYKADTPLLPAAMRMATLLRRHAHYFNTGQIGVIGDDAIAAVS